MTNYEILIQWLENTTLESTKADLRLSEKILTNLPSLVMYSISMTPLTLAEKLNTKLDALAQFADNEERARIAELKSQVYMYNQKINEILPAAEEKAAEILAIYLRVEKAKSQDFLAIFNPLQALFQTLEPSQDEDEDFDEDVDEDVDENVDENDSDGKEQKNTPFKFRKGGFYTKTASDLSYFALAAQAYMKQWPKLKDSLEPLQYFAEKYPNNQLAQILHQDKKKIVGLVESGEFSFITELGGLLFGRILYEVPQWSTAEKGRVFKMQEMMGSEKSFNADEFKFEMIKIQLFAVLVRELEQQPVAWIGSSRSVLAKVRKNPGEGAYLNCDDKKWSPQINRAWLVALLMLDYHIQIVEPQFPAMEKAILSGDFVKYIYCLASEMRYYDGSSVEKSRANDSMYHGGLEPTATMQELLLLLSMDCRTFKNSDGYLCVCPPQAKEELLHTTSLAAESLLAPQKDEYGEIRKNFRLRLNHSFGDFGRMAANPVYGSTFFSHPGASTDQRSGLLMEGSNTKDTNGSGLDDAFEQDSSPQTNVGSPPIQSTIEDDDATGPLLNSYFT